MLGFQECCDAITYSDLGQICLVRGWDACIFEYRPLGSMALNAIMYPYGLAPLSHALLLAFSFYLTVFELQQGKLKLPSLLAIKHDKKAMLHYQKYVLKTVGVFLLLELMFIGLASVNLTDVPAGVFAAVAIMGFYRKTALLFALAAGVSVLIRAAYLYPMLLIAGYFVSESLYQKRWSSAAVCVLFFVCLSPQYWLSYEHFNVFSFMDPSKVVYWRNFHFSKSWAGYDTLINPVAGHPWQSDTKLGPAEAFVAHQWWALINLFESRVDFYFGSIVPLGKVYLYSVSERIFSPIILLLHCMMFVFTYLYLKTKLSALRIWIPLFIILAQSLLILPEQRFIFVIQLLLLIFSYLYFIRIIEKQRSNLE